MKQLACLGLVVALGLGACGDNILPGDDTGGGGSTGSDDVAQPKLDLSGTYRVHSTFDIATNMPESSGAFVNGLIAATDDPDDPMLWVLDQMLAQMPNGTLKSVLQAAEPFVAGYLNDRLTQLAPDLVGTILDIGHHVADMTKHFGVNEKLVVGSTDQVYSANVVADGVRFTLDGNVIDLAFVDHDIDDVTVNGVLVSLENESRFAIGEHALPLPYGKIVRMGLDAAIIPEIDPTAHNLVELLDHVVHCNAVGANVASALGVGSAAFWTSVCTTGLQGAANMVYDQIAANDSTLRFDIQGSARAVDSNDDYKVDKLTFGAWSGMLRYDATDTVLVQPATFDGARM